MSDKFENLKSEASICTKCSLSSTRNKVVFGGGNTDADIFIIVEGPRYEEGQPGKISKRLY